MSEPLDGGVLPTRRDLQWVAVPRPALWILTCAGIAFLIKESAAAAGLPILAPVPPTALARVLTGGLRWASLGLLLIAAVLGTLLLWEAWIGRPRAFVVLLDQHPDIAAGLDRLSRTRGWTRAEQVRCALRMAFLRWERRE